MGRGRHSHQPVPPRRLGQLSNRAACHCLASVWRRVFSSNWRQVRCAGLEVVEHEQAERRRQIALLAVGVDPPDQLGQRHAAPLRNLLHAIPERLFEADAGLVAADNDRPLHDR